MIKISPGIKGAESASQKGEIAVIVDSLRASSTISAFFQSGLSELLVCRNEEETRELYSLKTDYKLAGEQHGEKPEGFHYSNSPLEAEKRYNDDEKIIFTSSNGARMLMAARGAEDIIIGGVINCTAVENYLQQYIRRGIDINIIPSGDLDQDAEEDMAAAILLAEALGPDIEPAQEYMINNWEIEISRRGLFKIFLESKHGQELNSKGLKEDIRRASEIDIYQAVPRVKCFEKSNKIYYAKMESA